MRSSGILVATLALFLVASSALAQQQVRLKSGGVLLGAVTTDGTEVVVQIDNAEMRLPIADVAEIAAISHAKDPRRLLITALEAKILDGADKQVLGLLAEAARLSPNDPQVVFWYATSLVDAGHGRAAHDALEPHVAAVRKAYPGDVDRLVARIEQRLKLDQLPVELVERLDQLAEGSNSTRVGDGSSDQIPYYAIFRVVDQHGEPVSMAQNLIQRGGSNQRLETFHQGYHLLHFVDYPGNRTEPAQLAINQRGLRPEELEIPVSLSVYSTPRELKVYRYAAEDKRRVRVRVIDHAAKPVALAKVEFQRIGMLLGARHSQVTAETDADGLAAVSLFPGQYQLVGAADGYLDAGSTLQIDAGDDGEQIHSLTLHALIDADVSISWRWTPSQGGEPSTGEAKTPWNVSPNLRDGSRSPQQLIRFEQVHDKLFVVLMARKFGASVDRLGRGIVLNWLPVDGGVTAARKLFAEASLSDIEKQGEKLQRVDVTSGNTANRAVIKLGEIYVGSFFAQHPQTGQPGQLTFKIFVDNND